MAFLVTGGAGYIGSHAVRRLLAEGETVVALDNLSLGHIEAIEALKRVADGRLSFVKADIGDRELVRATLRDHKIDSIMHFAALAQVGESVEQPLRYYRNNAASALTLIEEALEAGVQRFIFSSTCATYGEPSAEFIPIPETCPQHPINPYGMSKLHVEHMLRDACAAAAKEGRAFGFAALRYFNVAGSDPDGLIGEDHDPETHLIPVIIQAALGKREAITIFGEDYPTPDGTCIRDYVHVDDLIDAHVAVMRSLKEGDARAYNLGIGNGYSVREVIESVRRVTGVEFEVRKGARRPGDPPQLFADPAKIKTELGWQAKYTSLDEIVATAWRWFSEHPEGYAS
ncbi:UDP-glucose 4-epimerase [hydrothermal vent metagenome]|uniref:UDP-glucose 4-epimerase n=1 Tax=hydrothermal vent metagenome TaxID=652676 RepID=A0A3B1DQE7_9ZZZZ